MQQMRNAEHALVQQLRPRGRRVNQSRCRCANRTLSMDKHQEAPAEPKIDIDLVPIPQEELDKPYRVIILNDDVTTFEFVIVALVTVFELEPSEAERVALTAHVEGEALVAVLPLEEAKEKVFRVQYAARQHGFPLEFVIEPDDSE